MGCVWEYQEPLPPRNNGGEATFFWRSDSGLDAPDLQICQVEVHCAVPRQRVNSACHRIAGSVRRGGAPRAGVDPIDGKQSHDPIQIEANTLSHPDDMQAALACVEVCREVGNSLPLRPHANVKSCLAT